MGVLTTASVAGACVGRALAAAVRVSVAAPLLRAAEVLINEGFLWGCNNRTDRAPPTSVMRLRSATRNSLRIVEASHFEMAKNARLLGNARKTRINNDGIVELSKDECRTRLLYGSYATCNLMVVERLTRGCVTTLGMTSTLQLLYSSANGHIKTVLK